MRALLAATILAVVLSGCSAKAPDSTPPPTDREIVQIQTLPNGTYAFSSTELHVAPQRLLEWRNAGNGTHQISVSELPVAHTQDIGPGGFGQLKLGTQPGQTTTTWHLHCIYHPEMTMVVVVARP